MARVAGVWPRVRGDGREVAGRGTGRWSRGGGGERNWTGGVGKNCLRRIGRLDENCRVLKDLALRLMEKREPGESILYLILVF